MIEKKGCGRKVNKNLIYKYTEKRCNVPESHCHSRIYRNCVLGLSQGTESDPIVSHDPQK